MNNFKANVDFLIVPKITGRNPTQTFNTTHWTIPSGVVMADPHFNEEQAVDILLGTEIFYQTLLSGQINVGDQLPRLHETKFGWVVAGKIQKPLATTSTNKTTSCHLTMTDISDHQEKFEEDNCEEHCETTQARDETKLPVKDDLAQLESSEQEASTHLTQTEATPNSCPLNDPIVLTAFTPEHFVMEPSKSLPTPDIKEQPHNRLSLWQRVNQISQHLWTRCYGSDDTIREMIMKTTIGIFRRATAKMCTLPLEEGIS